jgi:hypothetical protein
MAHRPVPSYGRSIEREEEAERDLLTTWFSPGTMAVLLVVFVTVIMGVPATQILVEWQRDPYQLPHPLSVFSLRPHLRNLFTPADEIRRFETALENRSILRERLLGPTQSALLRYAHVGNDRVFLGSDGFLFFAPDIATVTQPPFFDDPTKPNQFESVIGQLESMRRELLNSGIVLVLMPVPLKPQMLPELLSPRRYANMAAQELLPLANPSTPLFLAQLRRRGFHVVDLGPALVAAKRQHKQPIWLKTDTHWAPAAVAAAGRELARYLISEGVVRGTITPEDGGLPATPDANYHLVPATAHIWGNMTLMLHLSGDRNGPLSEEQISYERVFRTKDGRPHDRPGTADIVILGDSFSQIYCSATFNKDWGGMDAGCLADHLALWLGRPVTTISTIHNPFLPPAQLGDIIADAADKDGPRIRPGTVLVYEFIESTIGQQWDSRAALNLPDPGKRGRNGTRAPSKRLPAPDHVR